MDDLKQVIKKIDDDINDTRDSIDGTIEAITTFENRLRNITQVRSDFIHRSRQILEPLELQTLLNRIDEFSNTINELRTELEETDVLLEESINKIKQLKKTKEFAKLIDLESFQLRNPQIVTKVLSNPYIFTNIKGYIPPNGGTQKKKNRKNKKTRKQSRK